MTTFNDACCPKCKKRFGWQGSCKDHLGCPRCGWKPDPKELDNDTKELEDFRKYLTARAAEKKRKTDGKET